MTDANTNARLETFCDGVFAIAMTLLIIDVKLPPGESIANTSELWHALQGLAPTVFAFVLSFGVIFITWVNHHGGMKLIDKSCASFIYGNGFLLLTVVSIPFVTSLLGEFLLTDHAAPAVVLYNAVIVAQSIGWILSTGAALKHGLAKDDQAVAIVRQNNRNGYGALVLYSVLSVAAVWFPLTVAALTTASWVFWLVLGLRLKHM